MAQNEIVKGSPEKTAVSFLASLVGIAITGGQIYAAPHIAEATQNVPDELMVMAAIAALGTSLYVGYRIEKEALVNNGMNNNPNSTAIYTASGDAARSAAVGMAIGQLSNPPDLAAITSMVAAPVAEKILQVFNTSLPIDNPAELLPSYIIARSVLGLSGSILLNIALGQEPVVRTLGKAESVRRSLTRKALRHNKILATAKMVRSAKKTVNHAFFRPALAKA